MLKKQSLFLLGLSSLVGAYGGTFARNLFYLSRPTRIIVQPNPALSITDAVVPSLNAAIESGTFALPDSEVRGISPARARELALAYAREYGPYNRSIFQSVLDRELRFDSLRADSRVFLAKTTYDTLSDRYSRPSKKGYGDYYLVVLRHEGMPAMTVAVSALATDIDILSGKLVHPRVYGNEFRMAPVPNSIELPITPERAVRIAASFSNRRVRAIPDLVAPPVYDLSPHYSRWRILLDEPATFLTQRGETIRTDTVYVDWEGHVVVRAKSQADEHLVLLAGDSIRAEIVRFPERPGVARHFQVAKRRVTP